MEKRVVLFFLMAGVIVLGYISLVSLFGPLFFENYAEDQAPDTVPPGDSQARYGANMRPVGESWSKAESPIFSYPYARTREALERLKTQIRASEIYALDSVSGLANRYGGALTSGLTVEDVKAWLDILQAVTEDDIIAAAKRVFRSENAVTGHVSPTANEVTQ